MEVRLELSFPYNVTFQCKKHQVQNGKKFPDTKYMHLPDTILLVLLPDFSQTLSKVFIQHPHTYMQGIWLAYGMRHTVETMTNLHAHTNKPMTKNEVLALCRMMALSKAITDGFHRCSIQAAESSQHIVQFLQYEILMVLQAAKVRY